MPMGRVFVAAHPTVVVLLSPRSPHSPLSDPPTHNFHSTQNHNHSHHALLSAQPELLWQLLSHRHRRLCRALPLAALSVPPRLPSCLTRRSGVSPALSS